jgi:hypothetical protein
MQQRSGYHQFFSKSFNEREYNVYRVRNSGHGGQLLSEFAQQGHLVIIGYEPRIDSKDIKTKSTTQLVKVAMNVEGVDILKMLFTDEFKMIGKISKKDLIATFSEPITKLSRKEASEFDSLASEMSRLNI